MIWAKVQYCNYVYGVGIWYPWIQVLSQTLEISRFRQSPQVIFSRRFSSQTTYSSAQHFEEWFVAVLVVPQSSIHGSIRIKCNVPLKSAVATCKGSRSTSSTYETAFSIVRLYSTVHARDTSHWNLCCSLPEQSFPSPQLEYQSMFPGSLSAIWNTLYTWYSEWPHLKPLEIHIDAQWIFLLCYQHCAPAMAALSKTIEDVKPTSIILNKSKNKGESTRGVKEMEMMRILSSLAGYETNCAG